MASSHAGAMGKGEIMKKYNDPPAFPRSVGSYPNGEVDMELGISTRTWLAGMAMQGLLSCDKFPDLKTRPVVDICAELSVEFADALMKELGLVGDEDHAS